MFLSPERLQNYFVRMKQAEEEQNDFLSQWNIRLTIQLNQEESILVLHLEHKNLQMMILLMEEMKLKYYYNKQ
ncbi:unnamed protein product [Paramecium octaurelia]|uniref:Uncharacterized protein n=1 Tax=Paramecium octaurelia TaxID=43137 RepID=A0A8S1WG49_PAROT|nr:unnamed protein product [Paramecium octaurelia]